MTAIAVSFVMVHTLNGDEVAINTDQITSITRPRDGEGNKILSGKVRCVIGMVNGKFHSVAEECGDVLRRVIDAEKESRK